eukprot:scaffold15889_cov184-Skeletonema_marinoi.AAC.1
MMWRHDGGLLRQAERKIFLQKEMMDWEVRVTWTGTFVRVNLGRIDLGVEFGRIDLCAGPTRCYNLF